MIITRRKRVEEHVYGQIFVKTHIYLFQTLQISLHSLYMSAYKVSFLQLACHQHLDDLIPFLMGFLVKLFYKIQACLVWQVFLIGILQLRYHGCNHDASDLHCVVIVFLISRKLFRSSSWLVDFKKRFFEEILFALISKSHLEISHPVHVVWTN